MPDDHLRDPTMTVIYGLDTCEDTTRARDQFDEAGRAYRYVRLDLEPAIEARLHARGLTSTPVVVTPAGTIAMEPSDEELATIIAATA